MMIGGWMGATYFGRRERTSVTCEQWKKDLICDFDYLAVILVFLPSKNSKYSVATTAYVFINKVF